MSEKINHWCIICGKGYYACDACSRIKNFTPWRTLADSAPHFQIYMIIRDYNNKKLSRQEARDALLKTDLSDMDSFKESARTALSEILKEEPVKSPKRAPRKKKESHDLS